jgi:hypothetical protein
MLTEALATTRTDADTRTVALIDLRSVPKPLVLAQPRVGRKHPQQSPADVCVN